MIRQSIIGLILLFAFYASIAQEKKINLKAVLTAKSGDPIPGRKGSFERGINGCGHDTSMWRI